MIRRGGVSQQQTKILLSPKRDRGDGRGFAAGTRRRARTRRTTRRRSPPSSPIRRRRARSKSRTRRTRRLKNSSIGGVRISYTK